MQCVRCSHDIPQDAATCPQCGAGGAAGSASPFGAAPLPALAADGPDAPASSIVCVMEALAPLLGLTSSGSENGKKPYEIAGLAGRGRASLVYRIRLPGSGRDLAIKRFRLADAAALEAGFQEYLRTADRIAQFDHTHIVRTYYIGSDTAGPFLVMEYVDGKSLARLLEQKGHLTAAETLDIARGIALGLYYAHRRGVCHLGLKPANVLLNREGLPRLTDFGVFQIYRRSDNFLREQGQAGMAFLAPELLGGQEQADPRSDIFSFGMMLYHLLTGTTPRVLREAAIPENFRHLIYRAVEERPEHRYHSMVEVLNDIEMLMNRMNSALASLRWVSCPRCGQRSLDGARFCGGCGGPLAPVLPATASAGPVAAPGRFPGYPAAYPGQMLPYPPGTYPPGTPVGPPMFYGPPPAGASGAPPGAAAAPAGPATSAAPAVPAGEAAAKPAAPAATPPAPPAAPVEIPRLSPEAAADREQVLRTARLFQAAAKWDEADACCRKYLEGKPDDAEIKAIADRCHGKDLLIKAAEAEKVKDWGKALTCYQDAHKLCPDEKALIEEKIPFCRKKKLFSTMSGDTAVLRAPMSQGGTKVGPAQTPAASSSGPMSGTRITGRPGTSGSPAPAAPSAAPATAVDVAEAPAMSRVSGGLTTVHNSTLLAVAISPKGDLVATAAMDRTVKLWSLQPFQNLRTLAGHEGNIYDLAFSPDGKYLASCSHDASIRLWNVESGAVAATLLGHEGRVTSVAFSPNGKLLASCGDDSSVRFWNCPDGSEAALLAEHTAEVCGVSFNHDGTLLASRGQDKKLILWDVPRFLPLIGMAKHRDAISSMRFTPTSNRLASCSWDSQIIIWKLPSGEPERTLAGHKGALLCLALTDDGRYLASGGWDKAVKLWEMNSGNSVGTMSGHTNGIGALAFSKDGKLLASASYDKTIRIWSIPDAKLIDTITGHSKIVNFIQFTPNARTLISGSLDNCLGVWRIQ